MNQLTLLYESDFNLWLETHTNLLKQEKFSKLTKIIPQRNLNAYNYCMYPHLPSMNSRRDFFGNDGNWKKGDFILHWPGMSMENRMLSAKHYSKQIVK